MAENKTTTFCRSVFKGGGSTTSKEAVTKMWAELINTLEKGKKSKLMRKSMTIETSYDIRNMKTACSVSKEMEI